MKRKRERDVHALRREALRLLVPHVHWVAGLHAEDMPLATELRRLGDYISALGEGATPTVLASFFGVAGVAN